MAAYQDVLGGLTDDAGYKPPARLATTGDLGTSLTGLLVIDGVQTVAGDRILVWKQTDETTNGIYIVNTGAWTRAIDFASSSAILFGTQVFVSSGASFAGTIFVCQTQNPVVGTTDIVFLQLAAQGTTPTRVSVRYILTGTTDTATSTDGFIGWDVPTGGAKSETLPAASSLASGAQITIKDVAGDAGLNPITITPASGTIDGSATDVINARYDSRTYLANPGTNTWNRI